MNNLFGVFDKVNNTYRGFILNTASKSDAIRGFIIEMFNESELSFFHDDFNLLYLGCIGDDGVFLPGDKPELLLTGTAAYKIAFDHKDVAAFLRHEDPFSEVVEGSK